MGVTEKHLNDFELLTLKEKEHVSVDKPMAIGHSFEVFTECCLHVVVSFLSL
jgi:hypothetical protein